MNRPDQITLDRFAVANAEFWLSMTARWLAEPGHADRFATDLWPGFDFGGPPVQVILTEAATRLRASLDDQTTNAADDPTDQGRAW